MYNEIIDDRERCCGCGACVYACPKHCLAFDTDNRGFRIVKATDKEGCISCGKCSRVCQIKLQQKVKASSLNKEAPILSKNASLFLSRHYAQIKDRSILFDSSSGGMLTAIATAVIDDGGVVWGIEMCADGTAAFCCADNKQTLARIRGSKYVEVSTPIPFEAIKQQLTKGMTVMFSGVPCQVKAVHQCLGDNPNLILIDLLCYGVQSPKVFKKYLSEINPKSKDIERISFRHKKPSWENYGIKIDFRDGTSYQRSRWSDPYLLSYAKSLYNRDCCSQCRAKEFPRKSDITLGDFWQIDTIRKLPHGLKIKDGLSVVICNTVRGKELIWQLADRVWLYDIPSNVFPTMTQRYSECHQANPQREQFERLLETTTFENAVRVVIPSQFKTRLRFQWLNMKRMIKRIIRR